jgi:hypothetical protein
VYQTRKVAEILLTARCGSHEYAVVLCTDGGYGVTRDGEILRGYYWSDSELDPCIETFMTLAGIEVEVPRHDPDSRLPGDRLI